MSHELSRLIEAASRRPWAICPQRADEIVAALAFRHANGLRREAFLDAPSDAAPTSERVGRVAVLNLMGTIAPRASAVRDASSSFASLERFGAALRTVANDSAVRAIVLNVDSPGGMVDLVPETAAAIRGARREGRPIYAVANTMAASAAYWIASQADRFFASPSAVVGSIGVRAMHMDQSVRLSREGLRVTHIHAGPRKVEGNPYGPLDAAARRALQAEIDDAYAMFVADVAQSRGVSDAVVRADPEKADAHMGGGRTYVAATALRLGMIDEIATLDDVLALAGARRGASSGSRRAAIERERLSLL